MEELAWTLQHAVVNPLLPPLMARRAERTVAHAQGLVWGQQLQLQGKLAGWLGTVRAGRQRPPLLLLEVTGWSAA